MPNTFSQLYIQIVFAVKNRNYLIDASWEENLYRYISGVVTNKDQKILAINGMPDHIHLLIRIRPSCCIADLVREIKKSSDLYVKEQQFTPHKFQWQDGYGAFSYNYSEVERVTNYIHNQKEHHKKKKFKEEYIHLLNEMQIEFEEEYLFDWIT